MAIFYYDNNMSQQEQYSSHQQPAQPRDPSSSSSSSNNRSSQRNRNAITPRSKSPFPQKQKRKSRSRSRDRQKNNNGRSCEIKANSQIENNDQKSERAKEDVEKEAIQLIKLKENTSKLANSKEDKNKKKKIQRQYLTDFTEFLPESLLFISCTNNVSKIRIGQRYQAQVQSLPKFSSQTRNLQEWKIWNGSSTPQNKPTDQHLWRFKQLLGQNRNEEELIGMRMRIGNKSWREVLQYVGNNKSELRRIFHNAQRNRLT